MGNREIKDTGERYLMSNYARLPFAVVRGEGSRVWDADGREYLDLVGGLAVNSLGHSHPAVAEAIARQARQLIHCSNLYWIGPQVELARMLVEASGLGKAFFCNSGAEANEAAIKLARKYARAKGREAYEVLTADNSFHGRTLATLTATAQTKFQQGFEPLVPGFRYVSFNDLEALEAAVGPETCAVLLEPVQGEGGVHVATRDYLRGVRELCDRRGLLLILDEVQCGLGRTGSLFAYQEYGLKPDVLTLAKALGGGVPIGALLAREEVAGAFGPGDHGSTFGGNPLACAAALATLEVMLGEGLPEKAGETGAYLRRRLEEVAARHPCCREVRGKGLLLGLQLDRPGAPVVAACQERGVLINCTAGSVLRFLPPLNIGREDLDLAISVLEEALTLLEKNSSL